MEAQRYLCCSQGSANCDAQKSVGLHLPVQEYAQRLRTEEHIVMEIKQEHNAERHAKDTHKILKAKHKSALLAIVRSDPSLSSTAVRRQIHQADDVPVGLHRSV